MSRPSDDLYQLLGVGRRASSVDLRRAYDWCLSTRQTPERRNAVRAAYAVLGDPRLRAEYDRGQVVGVGAGTYYRRPSGVPARSTRLERRWERRMAGACGPSPQVPRGLMTILVGLTLTAAAVGLADTLRDRPAAEAPAAAAPALVPEVAVAPYASTGSCFSADGRPELRPADPVPCEGPHLFEVVKNVDLDGLLGRTLAGPEVDGVAGNVCTQEFRSFTGLSSATESLWPTWVTSTGGGSARATCLVASQQVRSGSAAGLAD